MPGANAYATDTSRVAPTARRASRTPRPDHARPVPAGAGFIPLSDGPAGTFVFHPGTLTAADGSGWKARPARKRERGARSAEYRAHPAAKVGTADTLIIGD